LLLVVLTASSRRSLEPMHLLHSFPPEACPEGRFERAWVMGVSLDAVKAQLRMLGHDAESVPDSVIAGFIKELSSQPPQPSVQREEPTTRKENKNNIDARSDSAKSERRMPGASTSVSSHAHAPRRADPVSAYASHKRSWSSNAFQGVRQGATPRKKVGYYQRFEALHRIERESARERRQASCQQAMQDYELARSARTPVNDKHCNTRHETHQRMRTLNFVV